MGFTNEFVIIGHRGAAGLALENTLAGFQLATTLEVDAVELDVQVVDDHLVVFHDDDLKRLFGIDRRLGNLSWERLCAIHTGQRERIPELGEVLDVLPCEVGVNIELKGAGTGRACARYLNNHPARSPLLVSSFLVEELEAFHSTMRETPLALLVRQRHPDTIELAHRLGVWSIHVADPLVDPELVRSFVGEGFQVFVYTVNTMSRCETLRHWGVRGVFTDYPDRVSQPSP